MLVQKLRLQQGWSQQQLASMSGLSVRTVQRIENGQKPSVESIKSLAAVFEVDFLTLQGALTMQTSLSTPNTAMQLDSAEQQAYKRVRKLKRFYTRLVTFFIVMLFLTFVNWLTSPNYWWVIWVFLGWGLSFAIHAVHLFLYLPMFDANWEKRELDKQLKRK